MNKRDLDTMLLYGWKDKAFLHITEAVVCMAKKMAVYFNSVISQQTGHSRE